MTIGVLSFGYASSRFNGGVYTLNPDSNQFGGDFPFINQLLNASDFKPNLTGDTPSAGNLDANGYPQASIMASQPLLKFYSPQAAVSGLRYYAVQVTGKGTIGIGGGAPIITNSIATITPGTTTAIDFGTSHFYTVGMEAPITGVSGTLGTQLNGTGPFVVSSVTSTGIVLNVNTVGKTGSGGTVQAGSGTVGVVTGGRFIIDILNASLEHGAAVLTLVFFAQDATTPITKVAIVPVGSEETRYNSGEIFAQHFIDKIIADKAGKIRFLNKSDSNSSTEASWADRKPLTYMSYATSYFKNSTYAGQAGFSGFDWTATLGSGAPTEKLQVNLAPPTIAVTANASGTVTLTFGSPHGMVVNQAFNLYRANSSGVYPDNSGGTWGVTFGNPLFVLTVPTSTTITFCSGTPGSAAITTTVAPSGLLVQPTFIESGSVTFTAASSSIAWAKHGLRVNQAVCVFDRFGVIGPTFDNYRTFHVQSVPDADHITLSLAAGGAALVSAGSGTVEATGVPTLSLNGTTAKPIKSTTGTGIFSGNNIGPPKAGNDYGLIYSNVMFDVALDCWLWNGNNGNPGTGIQAFWPPEVCLELCKKTGTHPYFVFNAYMTDPMTDYIPQCAAYFKANAPAWMKPTFEGPNETWNTGFQATGFARSKAFTYWGADSEHYWYGMATSKIGQALKTAYGSTTGAGYDFVVGFQTSSLFRYSSGTTSVDNRITSAQYIASGPTDGSYLRTAAYNYATGICVAPYWNPSGYTATQEATWGNSVSFFTGSIDLSKNLTVSSVTGAALAVGQQVSGQNVPWKTKIVSGSGTSWVVDTAPPFAISGVPMFALDMSVAALYADTSSGIRFMGYTSGTTLTITSVIDTWGTITQSDGRGACRVVPSSGLPFLLVSGTGPYTTDVSQTIGSAGSPVLMQWNGLSAVQFDYYHPAFLFAQNFTNDAGHVLDTVGYEGGLAVDFTNRSAAVNRLNAFAKLVTNSPQKTNGMQDWATQNWTMWKNAGCIWPAEFQFTGQSPDFDGWSYLHDEYMTPAPPQELALQNMP